MNRKTIDWVIERLENNPELYVNDMDQDVLRLEILECMKLLRNILSDEVK